MLIALLTVLSGVPFVSAFDLDPGYGGGASSSNYTYTSGITGSVDLPEGTTVAHSYIETSDYVVSLEIRLYSVAWESSRLRCANLQIVTFFSWKGQRNPGSSVPLQERHIGAAENFILRMAETNYAERYDCIGEFKSGLDGDRDIWPDTFANSHDEDACGLIVAGMKSVVSKTVSWAGLGTIAGWSVNKFTSWALDRLGASTKRVQKTRVYHTAEISLYNYGWNSKSVKYPDGKYSHPYDVITSNLVAFRYDVSRIPRGSSVGLKFKVLYGYDLGYGDSGLAETSWVRFNVILA